MAMGREEAPLVPLVVSAHASVQLCQRCFHVRAWGLVLV